MSLVTRCPRCQTLYRVQPPQLQARAGQVRCGRCMHVFDGFGALAVEQPDAASAPVRFEPEAPAGTANGKPAAPAGAVNAVAPTAVPPPPGPGAAPAATPEAREPAPPVGPPRRRMRDFAAPLLYKPTPRTRQIGLAACLAFLLVAQAAYAFRSELAARSTVVRSVFEGVCGVAGCAVALPQRPDLLKIEASDVHMVDAARPQLIQLTATLRSYAAYDLAYPALDLVLTNANEHALARRIFLPAEYLDSTRSPAAGVAPGAEITVALDLDTGDLAAAGFRLDLIAAPAPDAPR